MSSSPGDAGDVRVADAAPDNWIDRFAPLWARPYLRLSRADRPIGTWLLLWPCLWSLTLAAAHQGRWLPDLRLIILFALGALLMRGAGCTYNDIIDRDLDAGVARTASRPLPSGQVTLEQALVWMAIQALAGLAVLLSFNAAAIWLGLASLLLVATYPFMKRITYWPQAWLGLTFNWGALLGWCAATGKVNVPAVWLYLAGIFWTLGYDTIYAHQDKEDDALVGIKSTAIKFAERTRFWLRVFYGFAFVGFLAAIVTSGEGFLAYVGLLLVGIHFLWQTRWLDIDNPQVCLIVFKSNRDLGLIFFGGLVIGLWL